MMDEVERYLEKADHALRVTDEDLIKHGYAPDVECGMLAKTFTIPEDLDL